MKALLLLLLAGPAQARQLALPAPAIPGAAGAASAGVVVAGLSDYTKSYIAAVDLSLARNPLYGSALLGSFERHLGAVATAPEARQALVHLRDEILGPSKDAPRGFGQLLRESLFGREAPGASFRSKLGSGPLDESQAGALLLANAIADEKLFGEVVAELDRRKPGVAGHLARMLSETGRIPGANPEAVRALRGIGAQLAPGRVALTYNAQGKFDWFFDGAR